MKTIATFFLILVLSAISYASPQLSIVQDGSDIILMLSGDGTVATVNWSLSGGEIKSIECLVGNKIGDAYRSNGIVYATNKTDGQAIIQPGQIARMTLRTFGAKQVSLSSVCGADPFGELVHVPITQNQVDENGDPIEPIDAGYDYWQPVNSGAEIVGDPVAMPNNTFATRKVTGQKTRIRSRQ